ncbi:MAG: hypothetical protein WGN25_15530 [Candidatus Electrothrix sp. GW3-4]|uniref:hypothetical protein n=1 Tax=Candidatus Electrothrix sp. GW3-4 TaxID=3126740 RepID=UPI0030CB2ED1
MSSKTYTEEEIQDLTDRVFLLKEKIEGGEMHLAPHLADDFMRSWSAVRLRPDGLVDPNSVDGRIRSATLAIWGMKQREKAKEAVSLAQIQDTYFSFLFDQLGWLYEQMSKAGATPEQVAMGMAQDSKFVKQIVSVIPEIAEQLKEFWQSVSDAGAYHLQDGRQLKATFAGDLFPSYRENVVSTAGLYIDTIILPCPVMRTAPLLKAMPAQEFTEMVVEHVLTAMSYRELAIADINPPIALVLANTNEIERTCIQHIGKRSEPAMLKHAQYLFGRDFDSIEYFKDFCNSLTTVEQVLREIKGADKFLFSAGWNRNPHAQLHGLISEYPIVRPDLDSRIAGHHVLNACADRTLQALATQDNALLLGGTPLINTEISWLYYTWLLEYNAAPHSIDERREQSMHIARALVTESENNLAWLGNVPPKTVLEVRQHGHAEEIREILGHGVSELVKVNPNNYFRTADQVVENIDKAFREHQQKLLEAKRKKLKLYGIDIGSFVATGTLAVTAAFTGSPELGAASALLGMTGGVPNFKDIKTKFSEIAVKEKARRASPTGLLFKHITS